MRVLGVYVFGSVSRGDFDSSSDIDVLIVYKSSASQALRARTRAAVIEVLGKQCTFAEYSLQRLKDFFSRGHLFAWHLFLEAKALDVPLLEIGGHVIFDRPKPYTQSIADAGDFARLLRSTLQNVGAGTPSLVFEAGIAYLALRNIGMCLSPRVMGHPVFTRLAPFSVSAALGLAPPIEEAYYQRLAAARHASQRGGDAPTFHRERLLFQLQAADRWSVEVIEKASEKFVA